MKALRVILTEFIISMIILLIIASMYLNKFEDSYKKSNNEKNTVYSIVEDEDIIDKALKIKDL